MPCNYGQTDTMLTVKDGKNWVPTCVIDQDQMFYDSKGLPIEEPCSA